MRKTLWFSFPIAGANLQLFLILTIFIFLLNLGPVQELYFFY